MRRDYLSQDDAFTPAQLDAMRAWLVESDLIGDSPLTGTFEASRGFAVTFTERGIADVVQRFPVLQPFLSLGVLDRPWRRLMGPIERLRAQRAGVRAYYLNVLVVPGGANVARHVDATLGPLLGHESRTPLAVSVAYLETPPGGALRLFRGDQNVAELVPKVGRLVCFRGDLAHEVAAVDGTVERISVVCEQYLASPAEAAALPSMKVTSRGRFGRVMARLNAE